MGKKSRRAKMGGGKADTSLAEPSPAFFAQLVSLRQQTEERHRLGSSFNDSRPHNPRLNAEAERIATEARVFKKAKQNQIAHDMYTRAIELDPYNHVYFHHRAETAWNAKQWELGIWDAQLGLDLTVPPEDFKGDECFGLLWCSLTRCHMELGQWEKAKQACEAGLILIAEENGFALKVLANYREIIIETMGTLPSNRATIVWKPVRDPGDDLMFVYTTKSASLEGKPRNVAPLQPEILAVDLDDSVPVQEILGYVNATKLPEWSQGPDALEKGENVFRVPETGYFVTAIPVWSREDRKELLSRLMCDCLKDSKVVLLRVEETEEPPIVDAAAYLAAVVKNAKHCKKMYNKGKPLAGFDTEE